MLACVEAPSPRRQLAPRNATEDAILAAAREALRDDGYERLTMDAIAKRAFVSRTAVYFYFSSKRAVVDRLIQRAFAEMYAAAGAYLEGEGEPRLELRLALARVTTVINREADLLLLAAALAGETDHLPPEWEPHIRRFVVAAERRIARDQRRGIAPAIVPPRIAAQALCAMVERHLALDVVRRDGSHDESVRVLAELWYRAVYSPA